MQGRTVLHMEVKENCMHAWWKWLKEILHYARTVRTCVPQHEERTSLRSLLLKSSADAAARVAMEECQ